MISNYVANFSHVLFSVLNAGESKAVWWFFDISSGHPCSENSGGPHDTTVWLHRVREDTSVLEGLADGKDSGLLEQAAFSM